MNKTDYLIIGQGLAGTLLSWELNKQNINHIVINSLKKPTASLVAAGMYNPIVFKRLTKSWRVDEFLPVMKSVYMELENVLKIKILHQIPIAKLINPDEKKWYEERIQSQNLNAYFESFKPNKFIKNINNQFEVALIKNSGYVNLYNLLGNYARFLNRNKQLINSNFEYSDLKVFENHVQWNNFKAKKIIFCEGSQAANNPYLPKNVFYLTKGDVLECEISDFTTDYIINKDVFILPKTNGKYLIGSTYQHNNLSLEPNEIDKNNLIEKAQKLILSKIKVTNHQAGIRPTVKDRRPIIGDHENYKNIIFFNGLGTKGVILAPYFAKRVSTLLINSEHKIEKEVCIGRFKKN